MKGPSKTSDNANCIDHLRLSRGSGAGTDHICDWPGCDLAGQYPAPKSRDRLREFRYFCLEHIRQTNAKWDYFEGMSMWEIEEHRRNDAFWHRPTWCPSGRSNVDPTSARWEDLFGLFSGRQQDRHQRTSGDGSQSGEREMMARLDLSVGFSLAELKSRYKALVKRYHPDLHGGDRSAEERLKLINEAYTYLVENRLYC